MNDQKNFEYKLGMYVVMGLIGIIITIILSGALALLGFMVVGIANGDPLADIFILLVLGIAFFIMAVSNY